MLATYLGQNKVMHVLKYVDYAKLFSLFSIHKNIGLVPCCTHYNYVNGSKMQVQNIMAYLIIFLSRLVVVHCCLQRMQRCHVLWYL